MAREPNARTQLKVRMRETLRAQIEACAKSRDVSLNTEILDRLERSFRADRDDEVIARLKRIEAGIKARPLPIDRSGEWRIASEVLGIERRG